MHNENQFISIPSFILRRIRRKVLLFAKRRDGFPAKTCNIPLINLSSFNMYFINLFSHFNSHRCRLSSVCKQQNLGSACRLHLWCLPLQGGQRLRGSEGGVTSTKLDIILPRASLSLAYPSQCTGNETGLCLRRAAQSNKDSRRRNINSDKT